MWPVGGLLVSLRGCEEDVLLAAARPGRYPMLGGDEAGVAQALQVPLVTGERPDDQHPRSAQGLEARMHAGLRVEAGVAVVHERARAVVDIEQDRVEHAAAAEALSY